MEVNTMQTEYILKAMDAALAAGKEILNVYNDPSSDFQVDLKSATSLTKCYRLKRNVLLIRNPPIQSARPFQCAYHPLTP